MRKHIGSKIIGRLQFIRWDAEFLERIARFAQYRRHRMILYGIGVFGFYICFLDGRRRREEKAPLHPPDSRGGGGEQS